MPSNISGASASLPVQGTNPLPTSSHEPKSVKFSQSSHTVQKQPAHTTIQNSLPSGLPTPTGIAITSRDCVIYTPKGPGPLRSALTFMAKGSKQLAGKALTYGKEAVQAKLTSTKNKAVAAKNVLSEGVGALRHDPKAAVKSAFVAGATAAVKVADYSMTAAHNKAIAVKDTAIAAKSTISEGISALRSDPKEAIKSAFTEGARSAGRAIAKRGVSALALTTRLIPERLKSSLPSPKSLAARIASHIPKPSPKIIQQLEQTKQSGADLATGKATVAQNEQASYAKALSGLETQKANLTNKVAALTSKIKTGKEELKAAVDAEKQATKNALQAAELRISKRNSQIKLATASPDFVARANTETQLDRGLITGLKKDLEKFKNSDASTAALQVDSEALVLNKKMLKDVEANIRKLKDQHQTDQKQIDRFK